MRGLGFLAAAGEGVCAALRVSFLAVNAPTIEMASRSDNLLAAKRSSFSGRVKALTAAISEADDAVAHQQIHDGKDGEHQQVGQ